MSRRIAFPFLTLPDEIVQFGGWMIGDPGQPLLEASDTLEHWDYARDLQVFTTLDIDWNRVAAALEFPIDEILLDVSLVAGTGSGTLPRKQLRVFDYQVKADSGAIQISPVIQGNYLSARLLLDLQISLLAPLNTGGKLSPKARGARLWQNRHDILIEDGGDSRFPVEAANFDVLFKGKSQQYSPWYLHWHRGSMRSDFSGTVRLYVNTEYREISERFANGDRATLQAIMGDVVSQMIESYFNDDLSDDLNDCDVGSVGSQIRKWLDLAFPGKTLGAISALKNLNPGEFRASILASTDIGVSE